MARDETRPRARKRVARRRVGREPDQTDMLAVNLWDLRANWEAQLRSMTAMQRCVDEYRQTADPKALTETARHLQTATDRHRAGDDGIKQVHETLSALMRGTDIP